MRATLVLAIVMVVVPRSALAADGSERIRLVVDAPTGCFSEDELVAETERIGGRWQVADEGERARRFVVTITDEGDHFTARLLVRDLVGRETVRSVESATCVDAGRSASLLVSLALDDEPEEPPPRADTSFPWPAPTPADAVRKVRVGSGGIVVSGFLGLHGGNDPMAQPIQRSTSVGWSAGYGARVYAAWRVGWTRLGASGAVQFDAGDSRKNPGVSGRVGGIVGWGAPWDDSVVGFVGDVGLAAGRAEWQEEILEESPIDGMVGSTGRSVDRRKKYVSPYVGASLVFQVPWKYSVRPVFGLGLYYAMIGDVPAVTCDAGVVWQAW